MAKRRVVVTGMAGVSPLGSDWKTVSEALVNGRSAIAYQSELDGYEGII